MPDIWFTADTHFDHEAILRHMPKRGEAFGSIEEMGDHLVDEINRVVRPKDILIHCGDFCWRAGRAGHWRQRLNVREIHVTQGNHDASSLRKHVSTMDYMLFKKFNQAHRMPDNFHMQHYPCLSWRKMQHKQFHLYGHSHGLFEDVLNNLWPGRRAMDVGIDHAFRLTGEWRPLSLDEVLFYMDHPPTPTGDVLPGVTPMDHHEPGRFICREPDPRLQHGDDPEAPGIWRK